MASLAVTARRAYEVGRLAQEGKFFLLLVTPTLATKVNGGGRRGGGGGGGVPVLFCISCL